MQGNRHERKLPSRDPGEPKAAKTLGRHGPPGTSRLPRRAGPNVKGKRAPGGPDRR